MVVWTQLANAFSMISPFICWLCHRKKKNTQDVNIHKQKATRLLSLHIPISFIYHFLSAFNVPCFVRQLLKKADLSMIHLYALKLSEYIQQKRKYIVNDNVKKLSTGINSLCIMRIMQGHEDTLMRLTGLYICSYNTLKNEQNVHEIIIVGSISSLLFYFDDYLSNIGHSFFHMLLGLLHHKLLVLL